MTKNTQVLLMYLFLAVATFMSFWQVNHFDFINFEDPDYIINNPYVKNGLTMEGIRWAFLSSHAANWHPLTWISHMLDVQFFGLNPYRHHLINLLFHIANTLLLFYVLRRMTKTLWQSAFVAALFALHPVHVESVAWATERKDVLVAFFWMLTMGAYSYYAERPGVRRYLAVLLLFVMGLLSKPMMVTFPFVLLLLDYWPLNRFGQKRTGAVDADLPANLTGRWTVIRPVLVEKIPLIVLTALSCVMTFFAQQKGGLVERLEDFPLIVRFENAFVSYLAYIGKMIWPTDLAFIYPYPTQSQHWQALGAVLVLLAVTILVIRAAKKFPYLIVGWFWYAGTLVPVIGFVQVALQARADRYTYIPLIGLFIMVAWWVPEFLEKWRHREKVLSAAAALILCCFSIITWIQVGYWRDSLTLFNHTIDVTDKNYVAYGNRGYTYATLGNFQQAIMDYDKTIELCPKYAVNYFNRGNAYAVIGNQKQAIADFDKAIEIDPKFADAYKNRAVTYLKLGNYTQGLMDLKSAAALGNGPAQSYLQSQGIPW